MSDDCNEDQVIGRISIDETFSAYKGMITDDWCHSFAAILDTCPRLHEAGNDLMLQWRVATRVADFPATMMEIFSRFAEADASKQPPAYMLPMFIDAWEQSVAKHAPQLARETLFKRTIRESRDATERKVADAMRKALSELSPDQIWANYLAVKEFRFRVWGTMQVCAAAVYNAYDGFLHRCAPKDPSQKDNRIESRLERVFGRPLLKRLFKDPTITIARELRHAISHNRGRMTDNLNNLNSGLVCVDGLLSVYPGDIRRFVAAMGEAAMELAKTLAPSEQ